MNIGTVALELEIQLTSNIEEIKSLAELTMRISQNAKAANTLRGYASDWEDFEGWCRQKHLQPLPAHPSVVAAYIAERATKSWIGPSGRLGTMTEKKPLKLPTLLHRIWGIKHKHKECGYTFDAGSLEIENLMDSLRRQNIAQENRKDPLLLSDVRGMVENLPNSIAGIRDKALLLVGFVSAMRRSEIAALSMQNLKFVDGGIEVYLNWSKTGARDLVIPYGSNPITCPILALKSWLGTAKITEGAIFRSINKHGHINGRALTGAAIALIVKRNPYVQGRIAVAAGKGEYTPSYAGHSLRAGFCSTAAIQGVPEHLIMAQAGHKKSDTTKKYIRIANKWTENAAIKIGL